MHPNQLLLTKLYTSFQQKDYRGMQECYHDKATFNDPAFPNLDADEVKAMWEMFCKNGQDLRIEFKNVTADDKHGSAEWTAYYTFSATGKKVVNRIRGNFRFKEGKIIDHRDHFSFYNWSSQSLGITGKLLGWTPFLKNKVRTQARKNLHRFMMQNEDAAHRAR
jgi:ketosteroid isomerase-like protein